MLNVNLADASLQKIDNSSVFSAKEVHYPVVFRIVPENGTLGLKQMESMIQSWIRMQNLEMKLLGEVRGGCWLRLCSVPLHGCEMAAQGLQAMLHETLGGDYYISYGNANEHTESILLEALTASAESARANRLTRPINIANKLTDEGVNLFRMAVQTRMLRSHLQPIMSLDSMRPYGYETLARIYTSEHEFLQNSRWIEQVVHSHDSVRLAFIMIAKARKKILNPASCPPKCARGSIQTGRPPCGSKAKPTGLGGLWKLNTKAGNRACTGAITRPVKPHPLWCKGWGSSFKRKNPISFG